MTYSEKLKDPRWQKRRLQVLDRAGWKCEFCHDETSALHVHHRKYTGEPWDAPDEDLECLCEFHHKMVTKEGGFELVMIVCNVGAKGALALRDLMKSFGAAECIKILEEASRNR